MFDFYKLFFLLSVIVLVFRFSVFTGRVSVFFDGLILSLRSSFNSLNYVGCLGVSGSVFLVLFLFNFFGLVPYCFTLMCYPFSALQLSFFMWVGVFLFSFSFSVGHFFSHLTPLGSPVVLGPFLVVIELVSYVIRLVTLGVRLMANLTAGHLLLGLMSFSFTFFSNLCQVAFLMFEVLVAVVQSYVFSLLVCIYFEEV